MEYQLTRRRVLGYGRAVATLFAASLLPPSVRRLLAEPLAGGIFSDIKHVVLLMRET